MKMRNIKLNDKCSANLELRALVIFVSKMLQGFLKLKEAAKT